MVCSHDGLSHSNENDLQPHTTEWMNFTNTVLSERSSIQESTYWIFRLRRIPKNGRSMLLEVRRVFPCWGGGRGGVPRRERERNFWVSGDVLILNLVAGDEGGVSSVNKY